ncbi:glycosyltransferase family 9 protein [Porphyromonas sp.]|uniref:glycosyltransferase family 9 protein n=1 Tax=Porphyromonas sp. TaxID=1924944 RepID=UPI0026DB2262|nr:glycosyltransferase family 9 protein [Porphyromonas sp.]MDO4771170.1 glycosyltransferase family 9 protein [Porphyromonas sp.]
MGSKQPKEKPTYICLRFSALGDVAMTIPLIYEVALGHPQSHFYFVTRPFMAQLFKTSCSNLTVLPYDIGAKGSWRDMLKLARELHKAYPTARIIDLHDVLRTKILRYALRLMEHRVVTLHKPRKERKALLRRTPSPEVPKSLYVPPMLDLYAETLKRAGLSVGRGKALFSAEKRQRAVGIAPFAQHKGKALPTEVLETLIDRLLEAFPAHRIILYGAPGKEKETLGEIALQKGERVGLSAAKGLGAEIEEIATLECMVSMDSANQHIASLVSTPVVSLWGATHPAAGFVAFGQKEEDCIGLDMECRPCSIYGQKACHRGDYACLHDLDISEILTHIKQYTT